MSPITRSGWRVSEEEEVEVDPEEQEERAARQADALWVSGNTGEVAGQAWFRAELPSEFLGRFRKPHVRRTRWMRILESVVRWGVCVAVRRVAEGVRMVVCRARKASIRLNP